jgi:drug/metabolite transporter (DMT)-like permease
MWTLLALTAALGTAAREALMKSVMRDGDAVAVAFLISAIAAALLLPAGLLLTGPGVSDGFWAALIVSGCINAAAAVMTARAVHVSDLSLVSPLQALTPIFMIGTGMIVLRELPPLSGALGIVVIVAGAYVLNVREPVRSVLAPFRALLREPGARLFLGVAAIFAVSGVYDKVGVTASAPLLWAGALNAFVGTALGGALLVRREGGRAAAVLRRAPARVLLAGLVVAIALAAQMSALPLTLAAYVIAVKRTSVLFSVLAGALLFRERSLMPRLTGAAIMLAGFVLVTLAWRGR